MIRPRGPIIPTAHGNRRKGNAGAILKVLSALLFAGALVFAFRAYGATTMEKIEQFHQGSPVVVITPTYRRPDQASSLAYLASILRASNKQLFWILVDDGRNGADPALIKDLEASNVPFWFLTPTLISDCKGFQFGNCFNSQGHRGVAQRNLALRFIRERLYLYCDKAYVNSILSSETSDYGHIDPFLGEKGTADASGGGCVIDRIPKVLKADPIIYFADDDNLYDVELFHEIGKVKRIGIVPVGFPWKPPRYVSAPVINLKDGSMSGFDTFLCLDRAYPVDMANIAFSAKLLHEARNVNLIKKYATGDWLEPYMNDTIIAQRLNKPTEGEDPEEAAKRVAQELADATGYKVPDHGIGIPPVRFYLHSKKYHLETDLIDQLVETASEFEILGNGGTRVLAWHVAKPQTQQKMFGENKVGRYRLAVEQPATNHCKIKLKKSSKKSSEGGKKDSGGGKKKKPSKKKPKESETGSEGSSTNTGATTTTTNS